MASLMSALQGASYSAPHGAGINSTRTPTLPALEVRPQRPLWLAVDKCDGQGEK